MCIVIAGLNWFDNAIITGIKIAADPVFDASSVKNIINVILAMMTLPNRVDPAMN